MDTLTGRRCVLPLLMGLPACLLLLGCLASSALAGGRVYWANDGSTTSRISFANLDGSGGGDLAGATGGAPRGVAIGVAAGKVYWTKPGNTATDGRISFANLDGSGGGGGYLNTTGATVNRPERGCHLPGGREDLLGQRVGRSDLLREPRQHGRRRSDRDRRDGGRADRTRGRSRRREGSTGPTPTRSTSSRSRTSTAAAAAISTPAARPWPTRTAWRSTRWRAGSTGPTSARDSAHGSGHLVRQPGRQRRWQPEHRRRNGERPGRRRHRPGGEEDLLGQRGRQQDLVRQPGRKRRRRPEHAGRDAQGLAVPRAAQSPRRHPQAEDHRRLQGGIGARLLARFLGTGPAGLLALPGASRLHLFLDAQWRTHPGSERQTRTRASAAGDYRCKVTASNLAGSSSQTSAAHAVSARRAFGAKTRCSMSRRTRRIAGNGPLAVVVGNRNGLHGFRQALRAGDMARCGPAPAAPCDQAEGLCGWRRRQEEGHAEAVEAPGTAAQARQKAVAAPRPEGQRPGAQHSHP